MNNNCIIEAKRQLSQLNRSLDSFLRELEDLRRENKRLETELKSKCNQLNATIGENQGLKRKIQSLEENNIQIKVEVSANRSFNEDNSNDNSWDSLSDEVLVQLANGLTEEQSTGTKRQKTSNGSTNISINSLKPNESNNRLGFNKNKT